MTCPVLQTLFMVILPTILFRTGLLVWFTTEFVTGRLPLAFHIASRYFRAYTYTYALYLHPYPLLFSKAYVNTNRFIVSPGVLQVIFMTRRRFWTG